MAQSGTGQTAHNDLFICTWATGTTLATAIAAEITTRASTWGTTFSTAAGPLSSPFLRMPLIRIYTAAVDGTLNDTVGVTNAPLTQFAWFGPITLDDTSQIKYTGSSSATVFIEC